MSLKSLAVFAAFMFTLALVSAAPVKACDTGGVQPGNPTFSFTAPQQVYAPQAFVAQPMVTQQFVQRHVVQQQFVAAPVQQFAVQHHVQQFAVAQPVAVQAVAVRQPRRQVQTQRIVTTNRASLFGR